MGIRNYQERIRRKEPPVRRNGEDGKHSSFDKPTSLSDEEKEP